MKHPLSTRFPVRLLQLAFLSALLMTSAAHAATTLLGMRSDPGDWIGGGQSYLYFSSDGTFAASRNFDNGVSISFSSLDGLEWWNLDFAAPFDEPLVPGVYPGAMRFPFQDPDRPGLDVHGNGRGCNTLTGRFRIHQVEYGTGDEIIRFAATFEQHCEGAIPALRGVILFNAIGPAVP
ncbi:MAG TPA: hypothetical protein ENK54_04495 [Thiotrichales bacterium]|nr:hypothetical protein [Thiotrichales bacterium]